MCVVSNIGDYFKDNIPKRHPWVTPYTNPQWIPSQTIPVSPGPTKEEFEALKKEVEALKELLKAAQIFDEKTDQPHCEHEDKIALIKKIAELVGVDLEDVLK